MPRWYLWKSINANANPGPIPNPNPDNPRVKALVKKIGQEFGFFFDLVDKCKNDINKQNDELKKHVIYKSQNVVNLSFVLELYKDKGVDFDRITVSGNTLEWHKSQSSVNFELSDDILNIKVELDGYTGNDATGYYRIKRLAE